MRQLKWFVVKDVCDWEWVDGLNTYCWVRKSHQQITPDRYTQEEANKDFVNLGFKLSTTSTLQCQDEIKIGETWTRYIVQCKVKVYGWQ